MDLGVAVPPAEHAKLVRSVLETSEASRFYPMHLSNKMWARKHGDVFELRYIFKFSGDTVLLKVQL